MKLLNDTIELGVVTLKVKDLVLMTSFYSDKLGLRIKDLQDDEVVLGSVSKDLIRLISDANVVLPMEHYAGLYHTALLLPESSDLIAMIQMLQNNEVTISGAADHLFSEAIYLNDPEGNGIEIYTDRPRNEWVVSEEGDLVAASNPLDIERLIKTFDGRVLSSIPDGTRVGHIHLSLKDFDIARHFYLDVLGLDVKTDMGSAVFMSKNGYHHHIAFNGWNRLASGFRPKDTAGLVSYEIIVDNLDDIKSLLEPSDIRYESSDSKVILDDGHGIQVILKDAYDTKENTHNN